MSAHDNEDNIKCPHCDHEHEDTWEKVENPMDCDALETTCYSCDKAFYVTANVSVDFDTRRVPCEKCELGEEYLYHSIEQTTCDRWNAENFMGRSNHTPYKNYRRDCTKCDEYEQRVVGRA